MSPPAAGNRPHRVGWAALIVALAWPALAQERPHLIATVAASPFTSLPDLTAAQLTVHAIPWVDLQGGLSFFPGTFGWWARGGLRAPFHDWRDEAHRGLTLRLTALAGYRAFRDARADARGFCFALGADLTYFVAPHLGFTAQLQGGGLYDAPGQRVLPELKLSFGVTL